jgi:2-pyrone-4,6-dicarboxylate lactonase
MPRLMSGFRGFNAAREFSSGDEARPLSSERKGISSNMRTTTRQAGQKTTGQAVPVGACDCHAHVYGPFDQFPLLENPAFQPPLGPIDALERLWETFGIERGVLVQGAAYGHDHRALLAAIRRAPENRRGIALLRNDTSDATLKQLQAGGVCGARINFVRHLEKRFEEESCWQIVRRIEPLGWHLELHVDAVDLARLGPFVRESPVPIVIDHMGRVDAALGLDQAPFQALLHLVRRPNCWVKLSGADRLANGGVLETAVSFARSLLQAAPERVVWGTDWPHVNLEGSHRDEALFNLLPKIAPDDISLARLLVDNPACLYGFEP